MKGPAGHPSSAAGELIKNKGEGRGPLLLGEELDEDDAALTDDKSELSDEGSAIA